MSRSERGRTALVLCTAVALGTAVGCAGKPFPGRSESFDYAPLPALESAPPPTADGAIWRGETSSGSFLFYDNKARGRGDLVTVKIEENVSARGQATTDLDRSGTISTNLSSDVGLANWVATAFREFVQLFGIDDPGDPAPGATVNILESTADNTFEGEGTTQRSGNFTATITCRVLAVLPGGVFHIRGRRSVLINHEEQILTLEALVRQQDIGIDNTVSSGVLAEAKMRLDGIGVIDDKQRPGWLARVVDWVYPF